MNLRTKKDLASRALKISPKRIKFNVTQENKKTFQEIISREGVRELEKEKIIISKQKKGNSKTRNKFIATQKKKGRRKGQGSRKGTANARTPEKKTWITKLRALRSYLKKMRENNEILVSTYRSLYRQSKGNLFRNKRHLALYLKQNSLLIEDSPKKNEVKKNEK